MPVAYPVEAMAYVVLGRGEAADLWTAIAALALFTVVSIGAAGLQGRGRSG